MRRFTPGVLLGMVMFLMGGTAYAEPTTVSASAGPVAVPNVPVEVCVDDDCQTTPALNTVSLELEVTADAAGALPTVTPGECDTGTGVVLLVQSGSDDAVLSGEVSGTLPDGSSFSEAIGPVAVGPGTTTVSACTTVTDGIPDPDLPVPEPDLPIPDPDLPDPDNPGDPLGGLGGLLGLVLDLLSGLLGGFGGGGLGNI